MTETVKGPVDKISGNREWNPPAERFHSHELIEPTPELSGKNLTVSRDKGDKRACSSRVNKGGTAEPFPSFYREEKGFFHWVKRKELQRMTNLQNTKISFIGAGAMSEAILSGLLKKEIIQPDSVFITNRKNDDRLQEINHTYDVKCSRNTKEVVKHGDILLLAVKPKDVDEAVETIKPFVRKEQLFISVLAGVSTAYLTYRLGLDLPIIRAMPNTSASIGLSATALVPGKHANDSHLKMAETLFQSIGTTVILEDEKDIHAVTGLSGSGPAYIYYFAEAMEEAARHLGISADKARSLVIQTILGAASMMSSTDEPPSMLRKKVTSEGGTTEAGIKKLEYFRSKDALVECIKEAAARSEELGKLFSPMKS